MLPADDEMISLPCNFNDGAVRHDGGQRRSHPSLKLRSSKVLARSAVISQHKL
jgi:hypothetical protein